MNATASPLPLSAPVPPGAAFARLSLAGKIALALLLVGVVALSIRLWPQWRHNPDLSHGLFMPVLFAVLLYEARGGTPRYLPARRIDGVALGVLLAGGLSWLVAAGLYAATVDWSHTLVNLALTATLVFFLLGALLVFSRDSVRLIPFNWPALVAIGLWVLSTPLPPGTSTRLTLGLQLWVSEGVLRALHLLGVAAIRHGNIIDLANTAVGVEEACSGVRSLFSCIFAAFFFSATLVHRTWGRVLIVALAAPLALLMNFIRSLTLTLLANRGVDISGTWHDVTGFAVLGVTAVILGGLALLLERSAPRVAATPTAERPPRRRALDQWMLAAGTVLAVGIVGFFVVNTRSAPRMDAPVPNLLALLPESATGWRVKTTDLYSFRGTLQTDHLAQRNYIRDTPTGPVEIIIYVAYWRAGQAPVSLVASHTPDACWPGAGWTSVTIPDQRVSLATGDRKLASAEHRYFVANQQPQHVWFWHLYDGAPITYRDPYSAVELLRIALRYGFRREGDQMFVRISSNRPWSQIAGEPLLADFFAHTRPLGL